ncbi:MAG: helix-turn-helix domain-containing protein [Desulfitobacteriaceae bacterium]|nr:helix-turn-helix domain-containing protein [Desulfitobacteriaceae bacterium]
MANMFSNQIEKDWLKPEKYLDSIIGLILKALQANKGGVMFFNSNTRQLVLQKPAFDVIDEYVNRYQVPVNGNGNAVRVFTTGKPYISNDVHNDPVVLQEYVNLFNIYNLITVPIETDGHRMGVLHLSNKNNGEWSKKDLDHLINLSRDLAPIFNLLMSLTTFHHKSDSIQRLLMTAVADGLQGITNELCIQLDCPVIILDKVLNILSFAPGTLLVNEIAELVNKYLRSRLLQDPTQDIINFGNKLNFLIPIASNNCIQGYIVVLGKNNEINNDLKFYEDVTNIFSLSLKERIAGLNVEIGLGKKFLEKLFNPSDTDNELLGLASFLGIRLDLSYAVVALCFEQEMKFKNQFEYYHKILKENYNTFLGEKDNLILLVPCRSKKDNRLPKVLEFLENDINIKITAGIGKTCSTLEDYPLSFWQARRACLIGTKLGHKINYYNELQFYDVIFDASNNNNAKIFMQKTLNPLIEYDQKHTADLIGTLEEYLRSDGNLTLTANILHVHINTLRYRLAKIEQLLSLSLKNPNDKYQLRFAFDILLLTKS